LNTLSQAVLQTVIYSDIFDAPLTAPEIHRYLTGVRATLEEVQAALENENTLTRIGPYFTLPGREEIVNLRKARVARSRQLLPIALKYGRILGALPFVRMVALTGSLAVMNVSKNADFDYMLVAAKGRVWTARAFALSLNRFARLFGWTLCPNLILSESALEWQLHDLYSARELYQMIPVTGMDVYRRLMEANSWTEEFLPNANMSLRVFEKQSPSPNWRLLRRSFQSLLAMTEWALRGTLGDRLERWEMTRKIARFSKQPGFGEETVFTAEVCQGNFHHHRKWTREVYEEKLHALTMNLALSGAERRRSATNEATSTFEEIASLPSVARNDMRKQ
jgi:hypothetical protein